MKTSDEFDCVKMKADIQRRLLEEYSNMDVEQSRRVQQDKIASDPVLGPFLSKVAVFSPASSPTCAKK